MGRLIRRAIRNQKKRGTQIVEFDFGLEVDFNWGSGRGKYKTRNGFCCPLAAVMLEYGPKSTTRNRVDVFAFIAKKFGRDTQWSSSFTDGVDGMKYPNHNKRAYELGKRIRKEFQIWR